MKVIFLDIDGVLNSRRSGRKVLGDLDSVAVLALNQLEAAVPGVRIVIISTWQREGLAAIRRAFWANGICWHNKLYDLSCLGIEEGQQTRTAVHASCDDSSRAAGVRAWLSRCSEPVESYVIIDDDPYHDWDVEQTQRLVMPNYDDGLTFADAALALDILNTGRNRLLYVGEGSSDISLHSPEWHARHGVAPTAAQWKAWRFPVVLQADTEEHGGGWVATIPDLGGPFMGEADMPAEALASLESLRCALYTNACGAGQKYCPPTLPWESL